jgi:predicted lipid-binding transport protein (Tim44 family)
LTLPADQSSDALAGLADIAAGDAGFDRDMFLDQARAAFAAVKQAVAARDLTAVAGELGPGITSTLQAQVERLTAQHAIHRIDDLNIDGMAIARAQHTAEFDHVVVRFDARAAQYGVDELKHELVFGNQAVQPFIEYWTFTRAAGVRSATPDAPPACPNCGAPIAAGSGRTCRYCRAALPARQTVDWMVTEIQDPIDYPH